MKPAKKPAWWPECPYPEDIFPMDRKTAITYLPDDTILRTAIAGALGRIFWEIASETIWERMRDYTDLEDKEKI